MYSELSKELKNGIARSSGSWVIDQILTVLIHNLKAVWPTKISMPLLSSLDNLL